MVGKIESILAGLGIDLGPETFVVIGVAFGAMLLYFGLMGALAGRDPVVKRMAAQKLHATSHADAGLLLPAQAGPKGVMKTFIPSNEKERTEVRRQLAAAGFAGPHSVRNYYLVRIVLGIFVPVLFIGLVLASQRGLVNLPDRIDRLFAGLSQLKLMQVLSILIAIGFFGPMYWLRGRVAERRLRISQSFPNALDLIQISAEAGLGFDAAMIRVGNELRKTAPDLSQELLAAQHEIQAGRSRDRALLDMAARTGVEEVNAFVNVVLQSIQFGTSISGTLSAYASEMRQNRELKALEKANKLPVQMSAVMAGLMLPALLLLTLGPVVIRYIRYMGG